MEETYKKQVEEWEKQLESIKQKEVDAQNDFNCGAISKSRLKKIKANVSNELNEFLKTNPRPRNENVSNKSKVNLARFLMLAEMLNKSNLT